MKRSEVNRLMKEALEFINERSFKLPPFVLWTPEEWETKGSNASISSGIIKNLIGSTKKQKHRCQKKSDNDTEYNTAGNKHQ